MNGGMNLKPIGTRKVMYWECDIVCACVLINRWIYESINNQSINSFNSFNSFNSNSKTKQCRTKTSHDRHYTYLTTKLLGAPNNPVLALYRPIIRINFFRDKFKPGKFLKGELTTSPRLKNCIRSRYTLIQQTKDSWTSFVLSVLSRNNAQTDLCPTRITGYKFTL